MKEKPGIAARPPNFQTTNGDVIAYAEELYEEASPQHKPWMALVARMLRAACRDTAAKVTEVAVNFSLDPIVEPPPVPQRVSRAYELATEGRDPGIDALVICTDVLRELEEAPRAAALAYLTTRFMGERP